MSAIDIILNAVTLLGTICTVLGVWLGWVQIKKIKTANEATAEAIRETSTEIKNIYSLIDIINNVEKIKKIQDDIIAKKDDLAHDQLRDLYGRMIELKESKVLEGNQDLIINLEEGMESLKDIIYTLQTSFNNKDNEMINRDNTVKSLNNIYELFTIIKTKHKNQII